MEFGEKLKELRKNKNLTQDQLAKAMFVSRTAISKWESGRGYPSIDLLKAISEFFSVSIDEMLSGEKILSIAQRENKANIKSICAILFAFMDIFSFLLIILPLYPQSIDGYVYAVNLINYDLAMPAKLIFHWTIYIALILLGIIKIILALFKIEKGQNFLLALSLLIGSISVLLLAIIREPYAVIIAFFLLTIKVVLTLKQIKMDKK